VDNLSLGGPGDRLSGIRLVKPAVRFLGDMNARRGGRWWAEYVIATIGAANGCAVDHPVAVEIALADIAAPRFHERGQRLTERAGIKCRGTEARDELEALGIVRLDQPFAGGERRATGGQEIAELGINREIADAIVDAVLR